MHRTNLMHIIDKKIQRKVRKYLSEVFLSNVHDLLRSSSTFNGSVGESEDSVAFSELLQGFVSSVDVVWGVVTAHSAAAHL